MICHFLFVCEINSVNSRCRACFLALIVCFSVRAYRVGGAVRRGLRLLSVQVLFRSYLDLI